MTVRKSIFFILTTLLAFTINDSFAQDNSALIVPFKVNNEHLIIEVSLNNSGPLHFIFDSGAGGTLINKKLADSLNLTTRIYRKNVGVSGSHKVGVIRGVGLGLADTEIAPITVLSSSTEFEELDNGSKVYGVIGFAILSRFVVNIDYSKNELRLYNSANFEYKGSGKAIPTTLTQNLPLVDASVLMYDSTVFKGRFMVDTGSRTDLIISSPTVFKYNMAENVGDHYTVRANIGTSDRRTKIRYGRLASFELSGYKFANIPVALSSDNKGVLSLEFMNGIIGNRLLQRFNLTFDYSRNVIYLEPSELIGRDYEVNKSGFNIQFTNGLPFITNVIDRSPADLAGLRNDDQIISINGVLVEEMEPEKIRDSFTQAQEKIELVILRNNKFKYTEFRLKPLI